MKKIIQKVIDEISKKYMAINILMLGLAIYIILFPIISVPIKSAIPSFGVCPYLQMTGEPCPLCGGTRYFANIFEAFKDIKYLFSPFGVMAVVVILQIIFRIKNIIDIKNKRNYEKIVKIDIIMTLIIIISFFLYEILYFLF